MANNEKNLIPNSERTPQQLKEMTSKAGKASGEARREKKLFQNAVLAALHTKGESGDTYFYKIVAVKIKRAMKEDTRAFDGLHDTSGEKQTDKIKTQVSSESISVQ